MGNYFGPQIVEDLPPFRISNFSEEEIIIHKLQFLKNILVEQKKKCQENEAKEIGEAIKFKKTNVSEAKYHLQKIKICRVFKNRIQDRIFLVSKQIQNLETLKDDIEFCKTIENGNMLIFKLSKEVDSKSFSDAIQVIENVQENSEEFRKLVIRYNAHDEAEISSTFDNLEDLNMKSDTSLSETGKILTIDELEKKEFNYS